jgi:hypothetical protein
MKKRTGHGRGPSDYVAVRNSALHYKMKQQPHLRLLFFSAYTRVMTGITMGLRRVTL